MEISRVWAPPGPDWAPTPRNASTANTTRIFVFIVIFSTRLFRLSVSGRPEQER
jgi:hypothetical protein